MTAPAANSANGNRLALGFGLIFADLYDRAGLERLDAIFLTFLEAADADLHDRLVDARRDGGPDDRKAQADLLLALVPHVEEFIGDLFNIADEVRTLQARHRELAPLHAVKRSFVQRRATKGKTAADAAKIDGPAIAERLAGLFGESLTELAFARHVDAWLKSEVENRAALDLAAEYATWATLTPTGQRRHSDGILFKVPHKTDRKNSIPLQRTAKNGVPVLKGTGSAIATASSRPTAGRASLKRSTTRITASGATIRARTAARMGCAIAGPAPTRMMSSA